MIYDLGNSHKKKVIANNESEEKGMFTYLTLVLSFRNKMGI